MSTLAPKIASELAREVYAVQSQTELKLFMMRPEFSRKADQKVQLKAEVGSRLINTKDGFGICALGGKGHENDIFLVFRGSTSANHNADWVSNARIGIEPSKTGFPVHIGFNSIFCSMLADIKSFITSHPKATGTIHCVGHSLGGAVATLAADWVKSNTSNHVNLYTFGAPRPGLTLFSWRLTKKLGENNIYRTYHATDPVPMIPLYPFTHAPLPGFGHYIPSNENILSAEAHDMKLYVNSVSHSDWKNLERRKPPYNVEHAVEEWLRSKIPVNPSNPVIWEWLNSALIYVLKKVAGAALVTLQGALVGAVTLADKIAWILKQGIDLAKQAGILVLNLMRKIMEALGLKVVKKVEELTQYLMRDILVRLMDRIQREARRAINKIT